jgi:uncharacterized protein (DUF1501 family)
MLHDAQPSNQIAREFVSAFDIVQSSVDRVRQAVTGTTFSPLFPNSNIGNQLRDIFISFRNFPTRFAYVAQGGYDLHENADPQGQMLNTPMGQSRRLRDLNDALAAFRLNCEATGIWQDTIIMITTEFSRTLRENGSFGVDHADGHVCFVLGGGVRGGHYGENPTPEQLRSPRNGIDATIASPDAYIEIARKMGLRTDGLLPAGYNPRSLGLFV